jgi:phenylpyruvate tautomerase
MFLIHTFLSMFFVYQTAVFVKDNADMLFGGSDAPTALGNLYSLGAINLKNNSKLQNAITDLLEPYGVDQSRIYINFFDLERENIGWNRATFGG